MTIVPVAPGQAPGAAAKLQALSKQLQLTPEQKGEMLPILEAEVPKLEAIKKDSSLSGMQKILSPAQYQQLQAIRQKEIEEAIAKKRAGG